MISRGTVLVWRLARTARLISAVLVLSTSASCSRALGAHRTATSVDGLEAAPTRTVFAAAVRALADSAPAMLRHLRSASATMADFPLSVDPRPLAPNTRSDRPSAVLELASIKRADVATEITAARSADLRRLAMPEGDALLLNGCPGTLSPPRDRSACPGHRLLVAALGLPDSIAGGRVALDIVLLSADSNGKNGFVTRYIFASRNGEWLLVDRDLPVIVE